MMETFLLQTILLFPRYCLNGVLYKSWKRCENLRNSSICKFMTAQGKTVFGSIYRFCLCNQNPVAIIAVFTSVGDALDGIEKATIPEINPYNTTLSCLYKVKKLSATNQLIAIPVSSIITKCTLVPIMKPGCDYDFISPIPNLYERH